MVRHSTDTVRVTNGGTTELLHDQRHGSTIPAGRRVAGTAEGEVSPRQAQKHVSCGAVSSDKRARQRAARQARQEELARQRKRRSTVRRSVTVVLLAGIAIGAYAVVATGKTKTSHANTSTTVAKTHSGATKQSTGPSKQSASTKAQLTANRIAIAAGCPANPHTPLTKPHWSSPPPMTIDTAKSYTATVTTDLGPFTIALDTASTPHTVNNFVFLADHGFYNCVIFHRVIPGFMDQTGDPTGTGTGGPGYSYTGSTPKPATPQYPIGSVAMANSGTTSSNGSQFFIVTGPEGESLPPNYTLFGHVVTGMKVVDKINSDGNPSPSANGVPPLVIHRMLKVTISAS